MSTEKIIYTHFHLTFIVENKKTRWKRTLS